MAKTLRWADLAMVILSGKPCNEASILARAISRGAWVRIITPSPRGGAETIPDFPAGSVPLVVLVTGSIRHVQLDGYANQCRKRGIPFIRTPRVSSVLPSVMLTQLHWTVTDA